jgi:hypothetical protein
MQHKYVLKRNATIKIQTITILEEGKTFGYYRLRKNPGGKLEQGFDFGIIGVGV